ncbi:STAS domain-containing protein [Streptomyces gardneri]|uniref:STAS domain-containing protein n=1 Tax=Streptomyces gardneri TaxID=66892 RepID=UPI0011438051
MTITPLVIHLTGEIDHHSISPLRALLASAANSGYTGLVLDTARVTFCDSAFLAVLEWWPQRGRHLRLTNRSRAVAHLLNAARVTGLRTRPRRRPRGGGHDMTFLPLLDRHPRTCRRPPRNPRSSSGDGGRRSGCRATGVKRAASVSVPARMCVGHRAVAYQACISPGRGRADSPPAPPGVREGEA